MQCFAMTFSEWLSWTTTDENEGLISLCSPTCFYQKVLKIIVVAQENVADGHKPSAAGLVSFFVFEISS